MPATRWTIVSFALVLAAVTAAARAGDLLLNFDRDTLDMAPRDAICKGEVKIVHHVMKPPKNLSVSLAWGGAKAAPEMSLTAPDKRLPERGVLNFDLLIEKHGGTLNVIGYTQRNSPVFQYRIEPSGKAILEGADKTTKEIVCVNAPPELNHWYNVRLSYDMPARLFNGVMDSNWKSGDVPGGMFNQGDYLERIVVKGEGQGESIYYLDTVWLVAAEGDANAAKGTDMPLGCYTRKIRFETTLADPRAGRSAIIVYPSGVENGSALGMTVRKALKERCGHDLPVLSDRDVVDGESWLVHDEYLSRPLIVIGNATDNRALYALGTRYLTQANRKWPGGDKYMVRSVLEPFAADVNWIIVEASAPEAMTAGVAALCKRLAAAQDKEVKIAYFREMGAAKGAWTETPWKAWDGIDCSKSIPDIKEQLIKKYGASVRIAGGGLFYYNAWDWLTGCSPEAAKYAAGVLLMELERDPWYNIVGHYNYDISVKAWQLCFNAGVVDEALMNRVEAALARSAANPAYMANDWYANAIRADGGRALARNLDRHWGATAYNFMCGSDYVLSHCRLNPVTREIVEDFHKGYTDTARRLTDCHRCRGDTSEYGDTMSQVLNHQALAGNLSFARNGALARIAERYMAINNNMGNFIGEGAYIGSSSMELPAPGKNVVAAAAFFSRDPQLQYVWNHMKGIPWSSTNKTNLMYEDEMLEERPERYLGVYVIPFCPRMYRSLTAPGQLPLGWNVCEARVPTEPREKLFDIAFFRNGFAPEDAFLSFYGVQLSSCMATNSIAQYADLGQVLLFCNTQQLDRGSRNSAMASNGKPCDPPMACIVKATMKSPTVSAMSSIEPFNGNTEATRTILHRSGHYFVVIDQFKAQSDDDYTFAVNWRSPHPAELNGATWTTHAPQGVQLRLAAAEPVQSEASRNALDGPFNPYLLTQRKRARLSAGQTVSMCSFFYASSSVRPDQCEMRKADDTSVLVRGKGLNWSETALVGVGKSPAKLAGVQIEADIFYLTGDELVAANVTKAVINGKSLIAGAPMANLAVKVREYDLGPALENAFNSAPAVAAAAPEAIKEFGLKSPWKFNQLQYPRQDIPVAAIVANRPSWANPAERTINPLTTAAICVDHNCSAWKNEPGPLQLTLDLGGARNVENVRVIGTIAENYLRRFAWNAGDLTISASCSDDNFDKDNRPVKEPPAFREYMYPRAQYSWTGRLPEMDVPIHARARYVRLNITAKTPNIGIQKIMVSAQEPQTELWSELKSADLDGDGAGELVVKTAANEIAAISADGKKLWAKSFPAEISAWNLLDVESNKKRQVVVYTAEDAAYSFDAAGKQLWRIDLWELSKIGTPGGQVTGGAPVKITGQRLPDEEWQRQYSRYLMYSLAAWKPDKNGHKEIVGWCKTANYGLSIKQDQTVATDIEFGGAVEAVSDTSLLGREVLAAAGGTMIVKDAATGKNIFARFMKAPASPNGDTPAFTGVAVVNDAKAKGFIGLNCGSVMWVAGDLQTTWEDFSTIPITSWLLKDLDGDGGAELLLGYRDGFVRVYRLSDGALQRTVCAGAPVVGIASLGNNFVVATRGGVRMYDGAMKEQGALNIKAVSAVTLAGDKPIVAVADDQGVIYAITP